MAAELPVPDSRFLFHGGAVAFAGRIRRPDDFCKGAASCHLPVSGGFLEANLTSPADVEPFHYKDVITFSSAYARASGDYLDPKQAVEFTNSNHGANLLPTHTSTESRIENLKVDIVDPAANSLRRTFTAKLLQVQMSSTSNRRDAVSFSALSAKFDTIQLATGSNVSTLQVETAAEIFSQYDTKAKLTKAYSEDGDFRKGHAHMLLPLGQKDKGGVAGILAKHQIPYADTGFFVGTIVKSLKWVGTPPDGTEILGHRLTIDGFGRIYFGEIVIDENMRRVTLLRFELGSPIGGEAAFVEAHSNGGGYPPAG